MSFLPSSGTATFQVTAAALIPTAVSFAFDKPSYPPGTQAIATIKVYRTDTGAGIQGVTAQVSLDGAVVGVSNVTDINGFVLFVGTTPAAVGSHTLSAVFFGISGQYASGTGSGTFTVTTAANVGTALAVSTNQASYLPSAPITLNVTLTRTDTLAGIAAQTVSVSIDGVVAVASAGPTNAAGYVTVPLTAPGLLGTHTITVSFAGAVIAGITFASVTQTASFGVGTTAVGGPADPTLPLAVGYIAAGLGIGWLSKRRRR